MDDPVLKTPAAPTPPAATAPIAPVQSGTSDDTRTIVTVICLLLVFPIGLILMWFWTKWSIWVKLLISIPLLLVFLFVFITVFGFFFGFTTLNPKAQIEKAGCVRSCENYTETAERSRCLYECTNKQLPSIAPSTNPKISPKPSPSIKK